MMTSLDDIISATVKVTGVKRSLLCSSYQPMTLIKERAAMLLCYRLVFPDATKAKIRMDLNWLSSVVERAGAYANKHSSNPKFLLLLEEIGGMIGDANNGAGLPGTAANAAGYTGSPNSVGCDNLRARDETKR